MRVAVPPPLACAFALAAAIAVRWWVAPPGPPIPPAGAIADDRIDDRLEGTVGAPVVRTPSGWGAALDTGDARVWIWTDRAIAPGERVAVTGRLRTPRGLLDPGAPDRAALAATRGADWELTASTIARLGDDAGPAAHAWRAAAALQARWSLAIDEAGGDPAARAALRGIALGDRGDVPDALDRRWRADGIYHVLSVSGLHLAVVAGLAFALLRRIAAASPWGGRIRPAVWAAPPALVLAIAYTMITGAQLATLRCLAVVAVMLVGAMLDRPVKLADALGVAAIAVLAWRPADLLDPSFQLSFTAALVLALAPARRRALEPLSRVRKVGAWLARGALTSAWLALATAPITAYHFHQVAAGGVIGNLALTPIVELVALPLALAGLVVGELVPALGGALVHAAVWLVALVDRGAGWLATAAPVGAVSVATATTLVVLVALSIALSIRRTASRLDGVLWLALCVVWAYARTPPPVGALRVTFFDVGQGDAALVELPDGATWLVDAGGNASARELGSASATGVAIAGALGVYDHTAVDLAIVSHPHPDHYLGFAALAGQVPIRELWTAAQPAPAPAPAPTRPNAAMPTFATITARLVAAGTVVDHPPLGVARSEAGVTLEVWGPRFAASDDPTVAPVEAVDPVRSVNDNSLVVVVRYRGRALLFAGDLEAEGEAALVAAGLGHVDVVKVPHHGSPTSSSPGLVAATAPTLAVISCGVANLFHFPSQAVVERWQSAGARVERTDLAGAITVTVGDDGELTIERFARAAP